MAGPSIQQILQAYYLDSIGANGKSNGGGGAADFARQQAYANFLNSNVGRLPYANDQEKKAAFERLYGGGGSIAQYGQRPNQAALDRQMARTLYGQQGGGGSVGGQRLMPVPAGGSGSVTRPGQAPSLNGLTPEQFSMLSILAAQGDMNRRNAANKARENEIRAGMDNLYNRVMGRVDNYGKTEADLIKERQKSQDSSREARLALRGLGNSSGNEAFQQRSDRDTALQLQNLSERVDDRAINYDTALTRDKNNFVERITDSGPEFGQMLQLAQQLGYAGGYGGGQPGYTSRPAPGGQAYSPQGSGQHGPQMTPWGPVQSASYLPQIFRAPIAANPIINPANPMGALNQQAAMVNQFGPGFQMQRGINPSSYPQTRSPEHYAALDAAINTYPTWPGQRQTRQNAFNRRMFYNYLMPNP